MRKTLWLFVIGLLLGAPSSGDERRLSPGVDLERVPQAAPARPAARRGSAKTVDLGSDRAPMNLALPEPPRGGAAGFDLAEGRRGWVARIPEANQLPGAVYGDGRVYVTGGYESASMYALDAKDGHVLWAAQQIKDGAPSTPLFIQNGQQERIVFNTYSCTLHALDARNGKVVWAKTIGAPTVMQAAADGGTVFASHPADGVWKVSAYALDDGKELWGATVDNELLAAPVVFGDSIYATTMTGGVYRFERKSGTPFWSHKLGATSAPWIAGDELFVSRRDADREAQVVLSTATGTLLRTQHAVKGNYLNDVPSSPGKQLWAFEGSRPVITGGVRYEAMGGVIQASDPATGDALWTRRYAAGEHDRSLGAVAVAGPQLVVATRQGDMYGLDVDTGYTTWAYHTGKPIVAQPIVAQGWVYATTGTGEVVALEVGDKSLDGWHMWGGNSRHN